jgi:hypothetical protein
MATLRSVAEEHTVGGEFTKEPMTLLGPGYPVDV